MSFLIKLLPNFSLFWENVFYQIWILQTTLRWMLPLYRHQSIDLQRNSFDWFLYDANIGLEEVRYNCSAHRSAHLFIIGISSHSHIKRKQPQRTFLQYSCSVTMINIVKKYLWRKIHKLKTKYTLIGSSNYS